MKNLFKEHSKKILIYPAKINTIDPVEKNIEITYLNPLPIRALVSDLTFAKIQWAMPSIVTDKAKEIVVEKKHRKLLEQSYKIKIQGEDDEFVGWKRNSHMQIREEGEYLRLYIYIKKD